MELQDDYANVSGNIIRVNNIAGYDSTYCAYGISYSQETYTGRYHKFDIFDNDVIVYNGDWAVYLADSTDGNAVTNNTLIAVTDSGNITGDDAVYAPFDFEGNN